MNYLLVSGPPASGKTTIAERIATELQLRFICKDRIKEALMDVADGKNDHVNREAFAQTYLALEEQLVSGNSCLVEANFRPSIDEERLQEIGTKFHARCLQIFCTADRDVLVKRFEERAKMPDRHPGHADMFDVKTLRRQLEEGVYTPLSLDGETIIVDTTNWNEIPLNEIIERSRLSIA